MTNLPYRASTTSGRAALYQAFRQLDLPAGRIVLAPTYHCPTMVAPIVLAGLEVAFYPLGPDGLPNLAGIPLATIENAGAIIVAHFFGMAKSLAGIRTWCDQHGIALIEDCAHCLFGAAGEQAIGTWGDLVTASLSKFLPVPEAGLLASNKRPITPFKLGPRGLKAQVKGVVDVLEFSAAHGGFWPVNVPMNIFFGVKNARNERSHSVDDNVALTREEVMHQSDMSRIELAPLWISQVLSAGLPWGLNIERRRQNFLGYLQAFDGVAGTRPLYPALRDDTVPYVFPLWVDDGDRLYDQIRARRLPVFRWDRIWPGTPQSETDYGALWSKHVLQLLCHQSLSHEDICMVSREIKSLL